MKNPFLPQRASGKAEADDQFVGAYIPFEDAEKLILVSLFKAVPKVFVIQTAISLYLKEAETKDIVTALTARSRIEWQNRLIENDGKEGWATSVEKEKKYQTYKLELREYLRTTVRLSSIFTAQIIDNI